MKKTSFLENIREKKADLSQSRISDTCIITGSTFLQQYYTSLLSFCNIYRVLQQKWDRKSYIISSRNLFKTPCSTTTNYPRQKATKLQKLEKRTTEEGKLLLACLASILDVFFVRLQNASFFSGSTTSKRDRIFCL